MVWIKLKPVCGCAQAGGISTFYAEVGYFKMPSPRQNRREPKVAFISKLKALSWHVFRLRFFFFAPFCDTCRGGYQRGMIIWCTWVRVYENAHDHVSMLMNLWELGNKHYTGNYGIESCIVCPVGGRVSPCCMPITHLLHTYNIQPRTLGIYY